jgi:hypothetical protein
VFPARTANFIVCSAQHVTSLIFIHESIMPRFRPLGASWLYHADSTWPLRRPRATPLLD